MSTPNIPGPLTVYRRSAMGSDFEVSLNEDGESNAAEAALAALDEVDRLEEELSVFRANSAVSRINMLAAEMNVRVDRELIEMLGLCRDYWKLTGGAFDITSTPLWELWGFARRKGEVPSEERIAATMPMVGMEHVVVNDENDTVAFDTSGVRIGFGGIGKGIALDRAARTMDDAGIGDFLIHGGRSSVIARGGRRGDFPESGPRRTCWTIGLNSPRQPDRRLAEIHLRDGALATSGSQYQFFRYKGERLAHIIDPTTGRPAKGTLSVTVIARDATAADALSTAFFIMGVEKTAAFCREHPEVAVLMLKETPTAAGCELVTFNIDRTAVRIL